MTMTYGQIESALNAAIRATLPTDAQDSGYVWVSDFSDSFVVYCQDGEYFQDDYTMDADGAVTLAGSPVAVKPLTSYVEMGAVSGLTTMLAQRGIRTGRTPELRSPQRATPRPVEVRSEPHTYRRDSQDDRGNGISYLRDRFMRDRDPAARARLDRHAIEILDHNQRKAQRALQEFNRGADMHGFESRVNPNPTPGTGGYFNPPAWLIDDAATYPRPKRVLANLVNQFPLPPGASSVNIPVMATGNTADNQAPGTPDDSSDVTDAATSCQTVTIAGMGDVAIQLLEMGPVSGATDHAWFKDLTEAADFDLETQLMVGTGGTGPQAQFTGLYNVSNINNVTYTASSPTGSGMYPLFGQMAAAIGKKRGMPPYAWLMRTARWGWLVTSEDQSLRALEFPDLNGPANALCPGAIAGWPTWMADAIPTTLGAGGNQDTIIGCVPQDIYLFEGQAVSTIALEVLSGTLEARFTYRNYAAAITGRYATGISVLTGTGLIPVSGY